MNEILNHSPEGGGDHVYLHVEKRGQNTGWAAEQLARFCGVRPRDVGYAGMKDRHALTRQWFSVDLAGKPEPDWSRWEVEGVHILETVRHRRKLRRGALNGNQFKITVRDLDGDPGTLEAALKAIAARGAPNYFGEQRFGRDGRNLEQALALFEGRIRANRAKRSIYLSAARAWLFNEVLSRRVADDTWRRVMEGDVLMLSGTHSVFPAAADELAALQARLKSGDLDVTGPLAGRGETPVAGKPAQWEREIFEADSELVTGLTAAGLEAARRPLCVKPRDFQWQLKDDGLLLEFELPAGAYATAVLRELVDYVDDFKD